MSWTTPSREEAEEFTKAYLAAEESYYEEQDCKEKCEVGGTQMSDSEKVINGLQELHGSQETMRLISDAIALLKKQPGVVRCKDCKYNSGRCQGIYIQFVTCYKTGTPHKEDWFCADGERKEGGEVE